MVASTHWPTVSSSFAEPIQPQLFDHFNTAPALLFVHGQTGLDLRQRRRTTGASTPLLLPRFDNKYAKEVEG